MLTSAVLDFCKSNNIRSLRVIVGVSGGGDSVSLLRTLHALASELELSLIVGHFNHNLRVDSGADAEWVQNLADQLELPCETGSTTLPATDEATARQARYAFFNQVASNHDCQALALAHTQDDQAETILHHIIRGTGLKGLTGIPETRPLSESVTLVRPLLRCTRVQVEHYLSEIQQPYRTDSTNVQTHYTRNYLRHEVLPQLRKHLNPQVDDALVRLATQASATQTALEELAKRLFQEIVVDQQPDSVRLQCATLASQPELLVREMLTLLWREQQWPRQKMTFNRWQELATLATSSTSSQLSLPGPVHAVKRRNLLELSLKSES